MTKILDHRGETLYEVENDKTIRECAEAAVRAGADLGGANLRGTNLLEADLRGANLLEADLCGANLCGTDLRGATLRGAYLRGATLRGADLGGANLGGADLRGASGVNRYASTPLEILREQLGLIRAYKLVRADGYGPYYQEGEPYEVGESYRVDDASTDESLDCATGISLCSLDWALRHWEKGFRVLVAEFKATDIAAIPIGSDGKFRVRCCRIVGEKDLAELDWPPKAKENLCGADG